VPKVSVTIPVYNGASFVRQTIDSVLAQTYRDYEIIVVNDGSTDDSDKILKSYGDRIRYLKQQNMGLARTRNKLISLAKGKYLAFLDQDDLWHPDKLAEQVPCLESDTQVGLVYSDNSIIDRDGAVLVDRTSKINQHHSGWIFEVYLYGNFITLSTVVIRKETLNKAGLFIAGYKISEEYDLFLKIARDYKIEYVNRSLACYRKHGKNASSDQVRTWQEDIAILDHWLNRLDRTKAEDKRLLYAVEKQYAYLKLRYIIILFKNGKLLSALRELGRSPQLFLRGRGLGGTLHGISLFLRFLAAKAYHWPSKILLRRRG
jgi:glycosyltransferase involved in cell wall biosynthesis